MTNLPYERNRHFMTYALNEARAALAAGELPVGCAIVLGERVIAPGRNTRHATQSRIAHAELNAIRMAEVLLYENRGACEIFVTLEPCMMCFGAIICSRFKRVVFGARDYLAGATTSPPASEHYSEFRPEVIGGLLCEESLDLLKEYMVRNGTRADWVGRCFGATSSSR